MNNKKIIKIRIKNTKEQLKGMNSLKFKIMNNNNKIV